MLLYHSFSRPALGCALEDQVEINLQILDLILRIGLLLTYEPLHLLQDPIALRVTKAADAAQQREYWRMVSNYVGRSPSRSEFRSWSNNGHVVDQSRACFTLLRREELFDPKPRTAYTSNDQRTWKSHVSLFGSFSIGIDPIEARSIGILPTNYFYPFYHSASGVVGLSNQFIFRLLDLQRICAVLAEIEAKVGRYEYDDGEEIDFPCSATLLDRWGITLNDDEVAAALNDVTSTNARKIFELFSVDRVRACDLHDFIQMLLGAHQTSDSSLGISPLEFYQQREWRVIFHMRRDASLRWIPLASDDDAVALPNGPVKRWRAEVLCFLFEDENPDLGDPWLKNARILTHVEGNPFHELIREIVVPDYAEKRVRCLLQKNNLSRIPVRTYSV